jgi:hypothetical protein
MNKRTIAEIQMLGAIKAWLDCPDERRPSAWALGRMVEEYADQFNCGAQIVPGVGIVENGQQTWPPQT